MNTFKALRGVVAAGCVVGALPAVMGTSAMAALDICVPEKEGAAVQTPKGGACKAKYTPSRVLPVAEAETLEKVMPYIKYEEKGIDEKPTIQFSGANVQVISGAEPAQGNAEEVLNGLGNLIVGYDQEPHAQTGSNNLVMGTIAQSYTSFGAVLGGEDNSALALDTAVFGDYNTASGKNSAVSGGAENVTAAGESSISGGNKNRTSSYFASVSGGEGNTAEAEDSAILGGERNITRKGKYSAIGGEKGVLQETEWGFLP